MVSDDAVWPLFVVKTVGDQDSIEPMITNLATFDTNTVMAQSIAAKFDPSAVH